MHVVLSMVLLATCCLSLSTTRAQSPLASSARTFDAAIQPVLSRHCSECHGSQNPDAGFSIEKLSSDFSDSSNLEAWRLVEAQLRFGDMPPADAQQPAPSDRTALLNWIRQQIVSSLLPGAGHAEKLHLPQFGNYVPHEALFDVRRSHVTPAPPRIWRLRPAIYRTIMPRLGERISGLSNALNDSEDPEFRDYAASYFLDEAATQQLLANAKTVAAAMLASNGKNKFLKRLIENTDGPETDDAAKAAIDSVFRQTLGRAPTQSEAKRFLQFYRDAKNRSENNSAARALVTAILLQPEFLFRQELGEGEPDEFGRVRLAPQELAFALSYALTDTPLDEFHRLTAAGGLSSSRQVAIAVRQRLIDKSPEYEKNPRLIQFFREYFHYPFATEVFKDQPEGGTHKADALVADLELTIKEILKEDRQVLRQLLTTSRYYVDAQYGRKKQAHELVQRNSQKRDHYHTAFSLPRDWKWSAHLQPVKFSENERAGVMSHPAWLAAWSGNFENHPVQRGKWIRTHLLGGTVPDVPIGVDARVPEMEHTTFRDRLQRATSAAECWRCHRMMDPLGLPFERYDHYGRVQRRDAGQAIDSSGEISRTDFPELHQKVSGPAELMQTLAESERVEQVFVRHVFRFFLGRNETPGDANTLQDAHLAYRRSDGSFNELVTALLSSDSFLLRQETRQ